MALPTATMAKDQRNAIRNAAAMGDRENHGASTLVTSDETLNQPYFVYVYNILDREYVVEQPPLFMAFRIPRCPKGEKFSWNKLGAFLLEPYNKPGTWETYYKKVDGRKCATSLLNPSAFPGITWESQLQSWDSPDQFGNNLNALGVFWSLTSPDEEAKLDVEIKLFRERATKTMNELVKRGEELAASGQLHLISPLMHFAMDYFQKQAPWHMTSQHMTSCPVCGESVVEGIAYHKNSMGEKCIIDVVRYKDLMKRQRAIEAELAAPDDSEEVETARKAPPKPGGKGRQAATS